jgi:hypothetical protein
MVRDVFLGIRRDDAGFQQHLFILRSIRLFIPHFFSFLIPPLSSAIQSSPASSITSIKHHQHQASPASSITSTKHHQHQQPGGSYRGLDVRPEYTQ